MFLAGESRAIAALWGSQRRAAAVGASWAGGAAAWQRRWPATPPMLLALRLHCAGQELAMQELP